MHSFQAACATSSQSLQKRKCEPCYSLRTPWLCVVRLIYAKNWRARQNLELVGQILLHRLLHSRLEPDPILMRCFIAVLQPPEGFMWPVELGQLIVLGYGMNEVPGS